MGDIHFLSRILSGEGIEVELNADPKTAQPAGHKAVASRAVLSTGCKLRCLILMMYSLMPYPLDISQ